MYHLDPHPGWDVPTIRREGDDCVIDGELAGYGGDPYPRLLAEPRVEGTQCSATLNGYYVCPLIEGHIGDHWQATPELAAEAAPVRVWAELVEV
jgi:hypothetical protein